MFIAAQTAVIGFRVRHTIDQPNRAADPENARKRTPQAPAKTQIAGTAPTLEQGLDNFSLPGPGRMDSVLKAYS